jgi:hypothetical protein
MSSHSLKTSKGINYQEKVLQVKIDTKRKQRLTNPQHDVPSQTNPERTVKYVQTHVRRGGKNKEGTPTKRLSTKQNMAEIEKHVEDVEDSLVVELRPNIVNLIEIFRETSNNMETNLCSEKCTNEFIDNLCEKLESCCVSIVEVLEQIELALKTRRRRGILEKGKKK